MGQYWYVKARNVQTGEEIERLTRTEEVPGPLDAVLHMKAHLVETGRADLKLTYWEIVEVRVQVSAKGIERQSA